MAVVKEDGQYKIEVAGTPISFLFEPYPQQIDYMKSVLSALNMKHDAVLESPTGTGKTLSLLCSTLAWLRQNQMKLTLNDVVGEAGGPSFVPNGQSSIRRIFYCSRTHSQLAQVVAELNRTIYKEVRCAVLGGREQLCTNEIVARMKEKGSMASACSAMRKKHSCFPYNKWDKTPMEALDSIYYQKGAPDIEDMVRIAKAHNHCAYYRSRQMVEGASLILLPYNYLLDPSLRRRHKLDLSNSIVIFDEAHNIVNVCEESASTTITTTQISLAISELRKAMELKSEADEEVRTEMDEATIGFAVLKKEEKKAEELNLQKAALLLQSFFQLEELIEPYYRKGSTLGIIDPERTPATIRDVRLFEGNRLIDLLAEAGLGANSVVVAELDKIVKGALDLLTDKETQVDKQLGRQLDNIATFIQAVHAGSADAMAQGGARMENFKFWINIEKRNSSEQPEEYSLNWACFDSAIAMQRLKRMGARTIILTSGTLAPLETFAQEMALNVGDVFSATHAAKKEQVKCFVVPKYYADKTATAKLESLAGTFTNRENPRYVKAVGEAIVSALKRVPQGTLVFFPSFMYMTACLKMWRNCGLLAEMEKHKKVAVEPKNKMEMKEQMMLFRQSIDSGGAAVFFAVCKGKLSEGINFADRHARAVIVVGLPYPPMYDVRVMVKKKILNNKLAQYREAKAKNPRLDAGQPMDDKTWYAVEAMRAVNQALGRVLRHKDDFGIVILLDERYRSIGKSYFPGWLQTGMSNVQDIDEWKRDMLTFFKKHGALQKAANIVQNVSETSAAATRIRKRPAVAIHYDRENSAPDLNFFAGKPVDVPEQRKQQPNTLTACLESVTEQPTLPKMSPATKKLIATRYQLPINSSQPGASQGRKMKLTADRLNADYFTDAPPKASTSTQSINTLKKRGDAMTLPTTKLTDAEASKLWQEFAEKVSKCGLRKEYKAKMMALAADSAGKVRAAYELFYEKHRAVYDECKKTFDATGNIRLAKWERIEQTLGIQSTR
ncbi:unnamed protein product, partial [Mesorhabditis spiculigera]